MIALHTGRRAAEIASLRCRDLRISSREILIRWPHLKGGKTLDDALPLQGPHRTPGAALHHWLHSCYGRGPYLADAPVWPSFSRNGSHGRPISPRSIANLCEKWLGMSQTERDRDAAWRLENGAGVNLAALFEQTPDEA